MARSIRRPAFAPVPVFLLALSVACGATWAAGCSGTDEAETGDDAAAHDATGQPDGDASHASDASAVIDGATTPDASRSDAADGASDAASDAADGDAASDAGDGDAGDAGVPPGPIDVYDPNDVKTYHLTFDAAAIALLSSTDPADNKTWVHGNFTYGGVTITDVGVRRKGSSTFRALPKKAALKIKFDKYVDGQKFAGLKELTLNNSVADPTFIAERLSYHVFRSVGLPAQRCASAQLTINGDAYGLYTNVETPNKDFTKRAFGAGVIDSLYEVNFGSEWLPGYENGLEEEIGDGTKADVTALFQSVSAAQPATLLADVAGRLDTNRFLRFVATEAAVGHYDGYAFGLYGSHNYFMAGDVNGVFSLVPWSTDLTMSNRVAVVDANVPKGNNSLVVRCKASPACWADYKVQMKAVLAVYETLDLVSLATAWHTQVHPIVLSDPKREAPLGSYNQSTSLLYTWLAQRPAVIRGQLGIVP